MSIETSIFHVLKTSSAVHQLVADKVYPNAAPGTAVQPYVVYQVIDVVPERMLSGSVGITKSRVQASCFGATYAAAKAVALEVKLALDGYSGTGIQGIFAIDDSDVPDIEVNDAQTSYCARLDFTVIE